MGSVRRMCRVQLLLLGSLAFYSLISHSYGSPMEVLAAPNLLRVGTSENIFVEIQDLEHQESNIAVDIFVMTHPTKSRMLAQTSVILDKANKFQAFGKITIPSESFSEDSSRKQYVCLLANFPDRELEKVVLVSFQAGYIFIQTDKSLYTPESSVLYRAFVMTPGMQLVDTKINASTSVVIDVVTPDGIVTESNTVSVESGMYSGSYKLGEMVSTGVWKLVVRFGINQQSFTTEFEVKEYVLPSFEVKLTPSSSFFYVDSKELGVDIEARYLYGKTVDGTAYVIFGVILEEKTSFPSSLQRVQISDGEGRAILRRDDITQTFQDINDLEKCSIYVAVSVLTESGSEMVEAELSNIMIVKSPYSINFKKGRKYFRPGISFYTAIEVLNPDGTPADDVPVVVSGSESGGRTAENGLTRVAINTQEVFEPLTITARTDDPNIAHERQASASMTAYPYTSKSNSYIHIGVDGDVVKAGKNLKIQFSVSKQDHDKDVTYLILSRGQLVKHGRHQAGRQYLISLNVPITKEMLPSFRIVAYYHTNDNEVVSDSVWVDVEDTCMGTLKLEASNSAPYYAPGKNFGLKITGDPGATVGLVAVDKAVYVLNNKHRLTQKKVWDVMETYDTGCTPGGGRDAMNVFYDAGLLFQASTSGTPDRIELRCPTPSRKKRAVHPIDSRASLVSRYTNTLQRECCLDGMREIPVSYSCQRRAEYIVDGPACLEAFLYCCTAMEHQRAEMKHETLQLARSEDDKRYKHGEEITSRTAFPESWLWRTVKLDLCPEGKPDCKTTSIDKTTFPLPGSITTWQFAAVSLSATHGICVANPFEVIVKKMFHIDLRLPYVAVRGEQLEIRAILHNDTPDPVTVRVDLTEHKSICSAAYKQGKYRQVVNVRSESTTSVSFILIPMTTGRLPVEVKAVARDVELSDMVKKNLRVVSEGILHKTLTSVILNPTKKGVGGKQEEIINSDISQINLVRNSPTITLLYLTGREQMDAMLENAISGKSMGSLIYQPTGCGEQNMLHVTLPVIATMYLDNTNQWEDVGFERRNEALKHIKTGYNNQLYYHNKDGSFSVYHNQQNSTWLTAYVAKVFAMASKIVALDHTVICHAIKFLLGKTQLPDGMFEEIGYIFSSRMMDEGAGSDKDASMTAFCLIAMQESRHLCDIDQSKMNKSVAFLEKRLPRLTNPYAVTMASYALANENKLNKDFLLKFASSEVNSTELSHWYVPNEGAYTLEATAYALLALVKAKAFEEAKPVVRWLNKQQKVDGGYGSTQATVMVYQAVAEYWAAAEEPTYNLDVNIQISGRINLERFSISKTNLLAKRTSFPGINKNVTVSANGTGEAVLQMVSMYYTLPKEMENNCEMFNLSVQLNEDSVGENGMTYMLKIEVSFKDKERNASMSILDIGLPTGFTFNKKDLDALSKGHARLISKYEMNTVLSEKGSVIIYLNKISNSQTEEITFKLHQEMKVGILQPAAVSVYEYNNKRHCVKYYHPERDSAELLRLCSGDVCICAEENCTINRRNQADNTERIINSCETTADNRIDFVYKIKVEQVRSELATDFYTVQIEDVIKSGSFDVSPLNQTRTFIGSRRCRNALDITKGKTYLVMGASKDMIKDQKSKTYEYAFGQHTWVEYWPTKEECKATEYQHICDGIEELQSSWGPFKSPCRS
ncbi:complement C3-like isoform X1 [Parambassis ranga]|uniref:Complement C3-like isoform X1 n=1 Tax=Parambassis ranga TaxID=210632 RepID=A0A6P7HT06_9TELE|nr:complement C3-like isoform X1 [Parambassis ranga]